MKKIYKILLLFVLLAFLSTYNHKVPSKTIDEKTKFYEIKNIEITNNIRINKKEIEDRLSTIFNKNIFYLKASDIESPLKGINFLKKVQVKKKFPDTVVVKIFETKPIGIIHKNQVTYILDSSSKLIELKSSEEFSQLPNIFGKDAESNFLFLFNNLKKKNFPYKKIKNYYYFQIGRWDLQFKNNQTIKFPVNNIGYAINKSIELLDRKDFVNYNIIDLRIEGKIIVE